MGCHGGKLHMQRESHVPSGLRAEVSKVNRLYPVVSELDSSLLKTAQRHALTQESQEDVDAREDDKK